MRPKNAQTAAGCAISMASATEAQRASVPSSQTARRCCAVMLATRDDGALASSSSPRGVSGAGAEARIRAAAKLTWGFGGGGCKIVVSPLSSSTTSSRWRSGVSVPAARAKRRKFMRLSTTGQATPSLYIRA